MEILNRGRECMMVEYKNMNIITGSKFNPKGILQAQAEKFQ